MILTSSQSAEFRTLHYLLQRSVVFYCENYICGSSFAVFLGQLYFLHFIAVTVC